MDEKVCDLLTQPYCERYRQNTICNSTDTTFIKKHYIEESIINPLNTKTVYKDFPITCLDIDTNSNQTVADVYKIVGLTVQIDDDPEKTLLMKLSYSQHKSDKVILTLIVK